MWRGPLLQDCTYDPLHLGGTGVGFHGQAQYKVAASQSLPNAVGRNYGRFLAIGRRG
jgi:hypothetical protein